MRLHTHTHTQILEWVDISSSRESSRVIITITIVFTEPGLCVGAVEKPFLYCSWGSQGKNTDV